MEIRGANKWELSCALGRLIAMTTKDVWGPAIPLAGFL